MASSDIKGFYRQKKNSGVTKSSSSKKRSGKADTGGATLGAGGPAHTPALVAQGSFDLRDEYGEEEEERLRLFDMDMRYGPCLGLTRLERWERAAAMGLNPPPDAIDLLRRSWSGPKPALECLWEGRV